LWLWDLNVRRRMRMMRVFRILKLVEFTEYSVDDYIDDIPT
jgi:hypothetical protein